MASWLIYFLSFFLCNVAITTQFSFSFLFPFHFPLPFPFPFVLSIYCSGFGKVKWNIYPSQITKRKSSLIFCVLWLWWCTVLFVIRRKKRNRKLQSPNSLGSKIVFTKFIHSFRPFSFVDSNFEFKIWKLKPNNTENFRLISWCAHLAKIPNFRNQWH